MHWHIRQEDPEDQAAISRVHREAFGRDAEARIVDRLRNTPHWIPRLSLVAAFGKRIIGHLLLSRVELQEAVRPTSLLALGPVGVLPEWQNNRVGTELISCALGSSCSSEWDGIVVLGHANFYPRFGFEPASRFGLKCPFEVPDANYMARELRGGGLANTGGIVVYPAAWMEE